MKVAKMTIEVNGQKYEIKEIKSHEWRIFFKFDSEKREILTYEYIDKHCEIIAEMFDGLTTKELIENLTIDNVMKIYRDILEYLMTLLTSKFDETKKNELSVGEANNQP